MRLNDFYTKILFAQHDEGGRVMEQLAAAAWVGSNQDQPQPHKK